MESVCLGYTSPKPSIGRQTGIRSNAPKGQNTGAEQLHAGQLVGRRFTEGKKQASLGQIKMLTETHKHILPNK